MRSVSVVGLGFGDEGKGVVTDYLTRERRSTLTVRFNGGCQAAHNVVTPDGLHHTFSQFGAGTLAGADTFLSRFMLVEPIALGLERGVLLDKGVVPEISIDPDCVIITPFHRLANRLREVSRGTLRHGSVGLGIGEARSDELSGHAFRARDIWSAGAVHKLCNIQLLKLAQLRELRLSDPEIYRELESIKCDLILDIYREALRQLPLTPWSEVASKHDSVVFEGAQGVLLDQELGFAPYNSWTDCTFNNADTLLDEVGCVDRERIGVLRSYFTRHGAGPFPTESLGVGSPEIHNAHHRWMGSFRTGHFDMVAARYAIRSSIPDSIALTHCDYQSEGPIAVEYEGGEIVTGPRLTDRLLRESPRYDRGSIFDAIEDEAPVRLMFSGPAASHGLAVKW